MNSISRALNKDRAARQMDVLGRPISAGSEDGESAAEPAPGGPQAYPVSAVIRSASRRRASARTAGAVMPRSAPAVMPSAPAPAKANYAWAWGLAGLALAAIGVGFIANSRGTQPSEAAASTVSVPANQDRISAPAAPVNEARVAAVAPAAVAPTPEPTPVATPIVVRVEIGAIESAKSAAEQTHTPTEPAGNKLLADESQIEIAPTPAPIKTARELLAEYKLDGIFYSAKDPACVINDKILEPGERVDGLTVKRIEKTYVVVEIKGAEYDLVQ